MQEEVTYTNIPSVMLNCVEPWLIRNHIEYTILSQHEIPEGFPKTYTFHGHTSDMFVACIKSHMDSEKLIHKIEEMLYMIKSDI